VIYRDLVSPLFTMRMPIAGFGILFCVVDLLIFLRWHDTVILVLGICAAIVTMLRLAVISWYFKAGGDAQPVADLATWVRRYAFLTFAFALLLAGLNVRVLMVHEPLMITGTVSLVFTFGAGVVSRTACRPLLCVGSLLIAVVPTAVMMLWHAMAAQQEPLQAEFFVLLGFMLLAVLGMGLDSVRHLYAATVEQLVTRHDLAKLARLDALTGLPNRIMLREAFYDRSDAARRQGTKLAIHYLDLDGFKAINDEHGHPAGDTMLREVAARLLATVRAKDVVFRLGGDEFVVMQTGVSHRDEAELLARRIIKQVSEAYWIDGSKARISVSVGIAVTCGPADDLDELIEGADAALYRSKTRGKSQLHFWEPGEDFRPPSSASLRDVRGD
jgi:diguanylate cyclase (GGDEF)-like protein